MPLTASEASKLASKASQPPAGTSFKTGGRPVENASNNNNYEKTNPRPGAHLSVIKSLTCPNPT